jgi:RimJ/RimL family protein N-acetyltransferase
MADFPRGIPLDWSPVAPPRREPLSGSHILVRPVEATLDAEPLYTVSHPPGGDEKLWTYLFDGPYGSVEEMGQAMEWAETSSDPLFFTLVRLADHRPLGRAAYLRITPEFGVIEIGAILLTAELQRTTPATEAIYLLIRHAFDDLGYRRVEWKCDAVNAASRRAAERFGFTFEGIFRSHMVIKGHNRDTAWYAITGTDWPMIRAGFESWLAPDNFDAKGMQKRSLGDLTAGLRS